LYKIKDFLKKFSFPTIKKENKKFTTGHLIKRIQVVVGYLDVLERLLPFSL
jgi:hypothetical protein